MNKKILLFVATLTLISVTAVPVFAVKPNGPSAENGLTKGNSEINHLYLYEKDQQWNVVEKGAWGKLTFDETSFNFNGHKLAKNTEYALIWYGYEENNDVWPYATCIAQGSTNNGGNIHLSGEYPFGDFLENGVSDTDDSVNEKIWLVLASDIDCDSNMMIDWQPAEYLFEYNVI